MGKKCWNLRCWWLIVSLGLRRVPVWNSEGKKLYWQHKRCFREIRRDWKPAQQLSITGKQQSVGGLDEISSHWGWCADSGDQGSQSYSRGPVTQPSSWPGLQANNLPSREASVHAVNYNNTYGSILICSQQDRSKQCRTGHFFSCIKFSPHLKVYFICEGRFFLLPCLFDSNDIILQREHAEGELFPVRSLYTYLRTAAFHTEVGRKQQ